MERLQALCVFGVLEIEIHAKRGNDAWLNGVY
jgi:hypothetical protein